MSEVGEVQRAFGYAGAGALALKALDTLVKWRSEQRVDVLAEFVEARKIGTDIREELRRELESTRIELAETEVKLEKSETELVLTKRQLAVTDASLRSALSELQKFLKEEIK